jgi:hypothetical protein
MSLKSRGTLCMSHLSVSVLNEWGGLIFSGKFPSRKSAKDFIEWRIEELLAQGAMDIVLVDNTSHTENRYSASAIAGGVFATIRTDWRYAVAA